MTKLMVYLCAIVLLVGCVLPGQPPAYLAKTTHYLPQMKIGCGMLILDENRAVTPYHCVDDVPIRRAIYQAVGETWFTYDSITRILNQDLALLRSPIDIALPYYPKFAEPARNLSGRVYGFCPYYRESSYRVARYEGRIYGWKDAVIVLDRWSVPGTAHHRYVCGGDSGGIVWQNGNVVGMIVNVKSPPGYRVGETFYTVPLKMILELYEAGNTKVSWDVDTVDEPHAQPERERNN